MIKLAFSELTFLAKKVGFFKMPMETDDEFQERFITYLYNMAEKDGFKGELAELNNIKRPKNRFDILREKVKNGSRILC